MTRPSTPPPHQTFHVDSAQALPLAFCCVSFSDLVPHPFLFFTRSISPLTSRYEVFSRDASSSIFNALSVWKKRIFFLPHCNGNWKVLNYSESGHIFPYDQWQSISFWSKLPKFNVLLRLVLYIHAFGADCACVILTTWICLLLPKWGHFWEVWMGPHNFEGLFEG